METHWQQHNEKVSNNKLPIAATLAKALEFFNAERKPPGIAVDLGCGSGTDTLVMLEKGWQVVAVDSDRGSLTMLEQTVPMSIKPRLTLVQKSFADVELPRALLINASFSLPFCQPEYFDTAWKKITNSLLQGGRFAGHFFGPHDSWATNSSMTFHTRQQLIDLFEDVTIESLDETIKVGKTLGGKEKQWHVFHTVIHKKWKS
jgi:tellurite methyltransferase